MEEGGGVEPHARRHPWVSGPVANRLAAPSGAVVGVGGIEPPISASQAQRVTASLHPDLILVDGFGFEPKSEWMQAIRFPD